MRKRIHSFIIAAAVLAVASLFGQDHGKKYEGPDDLAGDKAARREGWMIGNRVLLYYQNTTELSYWPRSDVSRWPNTYNGQKMNDGIGLLIGSKVFITEGSIPVTDPNQVSLLASQGLIDTLSFCQTNYREQMDLDSTGTIVWGFYPPFGYFNPLSESPAMSNDATSWPQEGWPAPNHTTKWQGLWNGRFGMGIKYADLECFFVANDAQDQEYIQKSASSKYYPRPGVFINADNTCQPGKPWGGLGLRVEQRGFQWNNPEARDAIFWEYTIANVSDYTLTEVAFGYWVDNAIGNDSNDDIAAFDKLQDLAYSWDIDGVGSGSFPTGTMGFAYLESPGIAWDGIDNDDDGIVDEKRDNPATRIIGATEGYQSVDKFLAFNYLKASELRPHWDSDEDQDWMDGEDKNANGKYDLGENTGDEREIVPVGGLTSRMKDWLAAVPRANAVP